MKEEFMQMKMQEQEQLINNQNNLKMKKVTTNGKQHRIST